MADQEGATVPAQNSRTNVEHVRQRLAQLGAMDAGAAQHLRLELMLDVLDAIANNSTDDAARTAAAFVAGVHHVSMLQSEYPALKQSKNGRAARANSPALSKLANAVRDVGDIHNVDRLFEIAEKVAHLFPADRNVLDFLYARSRSKTRATRREWETEVRTAFSTDYLIRNYFKGLQLGELTNLIDRKKATSAFDALKSQKGTLVLTFHVAFIVMARKLFATEFDQGQVLGRTGTIATKNDSRGALFTAMRVLQDGGVLMMSPDGLDGNLSSTLNVLDTVSPTGEGAAYLAYATNCDTALYTVLREDNHFVASIEAGPRRSGGETFKEFKDRLLQAYARRIESIVTGDPRNIVMQPRWSRVLTQSAA